MNKTTIIKNEIINRKNSSLTCMKGEKGFKSQIKCLKNSKCLFFVSSTHLCISVRLKFMRLWGVSKCHANQIMIKYNTEVGYRSVCPVIWLSWHLNPCFHVQIQVSPAPSRISTGVFIILTLRFHIIRFVCSSYNFRKNKEANDERISLKLYRE